VVAHLGAVLQRYLGRASRGRAVMADVDVAEHFQEIAELIAAQQPRAGEDPRVRLLHEVLSVVRMAAQRPGRPEQAVDVRAQILRIEQARPKWTPRVGHAHTVDGRGVHFTVSVPSIPAWRCEPTEQKKVYVPGLRSAFTVDVPPGWTTSPFWFTPLPSIETSCGI
jgi:hypothetical protein